MSWKEKPLGDLASIQLGKMLDQKKNRGDYLPYLGNDNVQWNEFKLGDIKLMRIQESERERFRLLPGDLLVCEGGDPGRCALWESDEEIYYQKALHRVRVGNELDARFLLYYMMHLGSTGAIRQYYTGGATIKHLPNAAIKRVPVKYPPLDEQRRIAGILSVYDALIENNRKQIKLLEEAAQRLYKEWFVRLRFPGHESTPIDPTTNLPEGWRRDRLDRLADYISRGVAPKYDSKSEWKVLGQTCIRNNLVLVENSRALEPIKNADKVLRNGDVLVNSTGVGSLGRTAQVWFEPERLTVDSHITIIRDSSSLYSLYLGLWAFSNEGYIESLHTGSTGQTELPRDRIKAISLVVPPREVVTGLNEIAHPLTQKILVHQKQQLDLTEARDRLLPKLMSGEAEV